MEDNEKINLFISYSHKDKNKQSYIDLLDRLKKGPIAEKIETWSDEEIELGSKWDNNIRQNLVKADIVILVISSDFLGSEYIKNKELTPILERDNKGECVVIPLFFRYCNWQELGFKDNQGFPNEKKHHSDEIKVINDMTPSERDLAFTKFEKKINDLYENIIKKRKVISSTSANLNETTSVKKNIQDPYILIQQSDRAKQSNHIQNDCKFFAIMIVNYDYEFLPDKNILNIKTNLNSLKKTFTYNFKIPEENITVLENNTSGELYEKLGGLTRNCPKDTTLFVYYSGHGIPDSDDFYWATKNTKYENKTNVINTGTAFEASKIKRFIEKSPAKNKILVCDCCYAEELLVGKQFINIEGYMKQKVELDKTFYLFSSEAKMESFYPFNEPGKATYFTDAFVRAFEEELNYGNSAITIGNIYERTVKLIQEAYSIENPIPTPIRQPSDHSLDSIELFKNPNKLTKSAIESQKSDTFDTPSNSDGSKKVEELLDKLAQELSERIKTADLSVKEKVKITKENIVLLTIRELHSEIKSITDPKEKAQQQAKLAVKAIGFPDVSSELIKQSQAQPNKLSRAAASN